MSQIRITGFASGLDTDKIIRDLTKAGNARADNLRRDKTMIVWQQEAYRGIVNKMHSFQNSFFDVLKPATNFRSATPFSQFTVSVASNGKESQALTASVRADSPRKEMRIDRIDSLATKDIWTGETAGIRGIQSDEIDLAALQAADKLDVTLAIGGSSKKISLTDAELASVQSVQDLAAALQSKVTASFGADYRNVVRTDGDKLRFDFAGSEVKMLSFGDDTASLALLGVQHGASSHGYLKSGIGELFGFTDADLQNVQINGVDIKLDRTMTLEQMTQAINRSEAGVTLRYNSLNDRFVLESNREGSAHDIRIEQDSAGEKLLGKLLGAADLIAADGSVTVARTAGQNAQVTIDGVSIVQGENTFQHEGVTLTLRQTSADPIDVKASVNTQQVIDKIKEFVNGYNEMLGEIQKKVSEKKQAGFTPLTDEEKAEITEKQAEQIEEKAKLGILQGSSELNALAIKLRSALVDSVEGVGITLRDIGIASASYSDKGKLTIDENKLKIALENRFDDVVTLFSKSSDIGYDNTEQRAQRTKESGLAHRIDDVIRDFARTTRDAKGKKGILIEKAGLQNDTSYARNQLSKRISEYDTRIADLVKRLADNETRYYQMFSRLEAAMSKMQSQSNSLFGMFGQQ